MQAIHAWCCFGHNSRYMYMKTVWELTLESAWLLWQNGRSLSCLLKAVRTLIWNWHWGLGILLILKVGVFPWLLVVTYMLKWIYRHMKSLVCYWQVHRDSNVSCCSAIGIKYLKLQYHFYLPVFLFLFHTSFTFI